MYPNLKLQLWRSGIRQNRLARMLSMDETTLSRIVNGFRAPSDEVKLNIAKLLECDCEWLFQPCDDTLLSVKTGAAKLPAPENR